MPWLSRNNFTPTDKLHADDLNNLANDDRVWGGNVNGGGYTLSNVNIIGINPQAGGGGGVTTWNGQTGDVMPRGGGLDYTAAMVGAAPLTRQVIAGPGLSGGGPLSADITLTAAVQSFNTRIGAITLTPADITAATGVLNTRKIITAPGSGLQNGGMLTADLSLSVVPDSSNQQVQIMSQGNPIGIPRHAINFVSGTGALVTVTENTTNNRIDVQVASTGSGSGFVDPTTTQGDLIARGLSAPATRLAIGADGQVLTVDHLQPQMLKWVTPTVPPVTSVFGRIGAIVASASDGYTAAMIAGAVDQGGAYINPPWIKGLDWHVITNAPAFMLDPTSAKGDLIARSASATTAFPVGVDGSILTADSSMARGLRWSPPAVTSVFGRTGGTVPGAVVAAGGDYDVSQVTNAASALTVFNAGTGLTGGGNLGSNRTFSVVPNTTVQQIEIWQEGTTKVGTRKGINFKSGAGVALTITDGSGGASDWVNVTVASSGTGSGGGMVDPTSALGDLIVRSVILPAPPTALPIGTQGQVLTVDTTQSGKMRWATPSGGGAGSQTPWAGDIDAAGHALNNAGGIGLNIAAAPTAARIYAFVSGTEQAFAGVVTNAANVASIALLNDVNDSISLKSYGTGYVGGFPGILTLEATKALAVIASGAEVMRLTTGRVLIGTTTDDGVNTVQVNGKVKSKTGGFVFPDNSIQTTAYTAASSPVTSVFGRTGAVIAKLTAPFDYSASNVTNAVDSSATYNDPVWINTLAWSKITGAPAMLVDPTTTKGDVIARGTTGPATRLAAGTNGFVLTADSAATLGVKWAAPSQTPWTSNINGAGFNLTGVSALAINMSTFTDVLTIGAVSYVANQNGGIKLQSPGNEVSSRYALKLDGAGNFRVGFDYQGLEVLTLANIGTVNGIGINNSTPICAIAPVISRTAAYNAGNSSTWADIIIENAQAGGGGSGTAQAATGIGFNVSGYHNNQTVVAGIAAIRTIGTGDTSLDLAFITRAQNVTQSETMRLTAGGHLGIGTPAPVLPLSVVGNMAGAYQGVVIANLDSTTGNKTTLGFALGNQGATLTASISNLLESSSVAGMTFSTYNSGLAERMRILGGGQVCIGTATPVTTPGTFSLTVYSNALRNICAVSDGSEAGICISNLAAGGHAWSLYSSGGSTGIGQGFFSIYDDTAQGPRMVIGANGYFGFNLYPPAYAFHVNSGICAQEQSQVTTTIGLDPGGTPSGTSTMAMWYDNASAFGRLEAITSGQVWRNIAANPRGGSFCVGPGFSSGYTPLALCDVCSMTAGVVDVLMLRSAIAAGGHGPALVWGQNSGSALQARLAGIYDGNANALDFVFTSYNNGAVGEKMRIKGTGNVCIGTATPTGRLTILPPGGTATVALSNQISIGEGTDNASYRLNIGYGSFAGWCGVLQTTPGGVALALNPSGNFVSINKGSTSAAYQLDVTGDINCTGAFRINGTAINTSGGGIQGISVQINSGGNQPGPFTWLNFYQLTGMAISSGGVSGPGNNTMTIQFGTASDLRLKRNVQTLDGGLPLIMQLRPISAEFNGLAYTREGLKVTSVIAQELRQVIPDAVEPYRTKLRPEDEEDTELLSIDPMAITSHLILAIQQLEARLKMLEAKVN